MGEVIEVADLFCGAGGSSTGILDALREMGEEAALVAVNHWRVAVATHTENHPDQRPAICAELDSTRPIDLVPGGHLHYLWASPECTDFSRAKGGKPVSDQRRMSPWLINRWLADLDVEVVMVENVPEFVEWGPLLPDGRRDPKHKGLYFQAWFNSLREMGYEVEWRRLNAADYGDATTRTRFFLQARKDGLPVRWPEPSHARNGRHSMFGTMPRWRAAAEVIDWTDPGPSLLDRKKPLSVKTRLRIARGLERFGGPLAPYYIRLLDLPVDHSAGFSTKIAPFTFANRTNNAPKGMDEPVAAITTTTGGGIATVTPFLSAYHDREDTARPVTEPLPTADKANRFGLVEPTAEPFVLAQGGGGEARPVSEPLPTIVAKGAESLVQPHLVGYHRTSGAYDVQEPVPTLTTKDRLALATPLIATLRGTEDAHLNSSAKPVDEPVPTISAGGNHHGLVTPIITTHRGQSTARSTNEPLSTISSGGGHHGLASPLAVPYGPKAEARPTSEPLPTILTKDRLGVATPEAVVITHQDRGKPWARSADEPLPTITTVGRQYVATPEAVVVNTDISHQAGKGVRSASEPLTTITASGKRHAVATPEAFIVPRFGEREGQAPRVHGIDEPLPTQTQTVQHNLTTPMLVQMAHTEREDDGMVRDVAEPVPTVTTRINLAVATAELAEGRSDVDPRRLVEIDGQTYLLDIRFRMLRNPELAAAMGFPTDYRFHGKVAEVTAQIGNAVCRNLAKALTMAALGPRKEAAA